MKKISKIRKKNKLLELDRRVFLERSIATASLMAFGLRSNLYAAGVVQKNTRRVIQIVLGGGFDSVLSTDPLVGSKHGKWIGSTTGTGNSELSINYDPRYNPDVSSDVAIYDVRSKANLMVGAGLKNALNAFGSVPTCFINGLYNPITAHEPALNYILSGKNTLDSRTPELNYLANIINEDNLISQLILGKNTSIAPEGSLSVPDLVSFKKSLAGINLSELGGHESKIKGVHLDIMQKLRHKLTGKRFLKNYSSKTESWLNATDRASEVLKKNFNTGIGLEQDFALRERYGVKSVGDEWSLGALLLGAFQSIKVSLANNIIVNAAGFDTHSDHLKIHLPLMNNFAKALNALVEDLSFHIDPLTNEPFMNSTTIIISSEFTRTPNFNESAGTDHWMSTSAIIMGAGVNDNGSGLVVGATDDNGYPLGWENGGSVDFHSSNKITPADLAATVLDSFGQTAAAKKISQRRIHGIFK